MIIKHNIKTNYTEMIDLINRYIMQARMKKLSYTSDFLRIEYRDGDLFEMWGYEIIENVSEYIFKNKEIEAVKIKINGNTHKFYY